MSIIANALATALAALATARGETVAYRAVQGTGSFTTLTGFVIDRDEQVPPEFQAMLGSQLYDQRARMVGPLTPALAIGNEVQDGNGLLWAVVRVDFDMQQIALLARATVDRAGFDRGNAS